MSDRKQQGRRSNKKKKIFARPPVLLLCSLRRGERATTPLPPSWVAPATLAEKERGEGAPDLAFPGRRRAIVIVMEEVEEEGEEAGALPPASAPSAGVHPMVPVQEALRIALEESARIAALRLAAGAGSSGGPERVGAASSPGDGEAPLLLGRTLARPVVMPEPGYPPYRASVMDGYAVSSSASASAHSRRGELPAEAAPRRLSRFRVSGRVHAGDGVGGCAPAPCLALAGAAASDLPEACYVTTGAPVPDAFDCVVPVEDVTVLQIPPQDGDESAATTTTVVEIRDGDKVASILKPGKWIRSPGCDLPAGRAVVEAGRELDAAALGLLLQASPAGAGGGTVEVLRRIRVGVLSTGNEVVDGSEWLAPPSSSPSLSGAAALAAAAKIPDANRPALLSLLSSWRCCEAVDLGIVPDGDGPGAAAEALRRAVVGESGCDAVVTTGGISVGDADRVEAALLMLGAQVRFGRLHMKPGKPTTLASLDRHLLFCLPGNPVSALVCAHLLVRPCLELLYRAPLALAAAAAATRNGQQEGPGPAAAPLDPSEMRRQLVEDLPVLHAEVPVVLRDDLALDAERPEYHRVRLEPSWTTASAGPGVVFLARSTGAQQSSRLASLLGADALVPLPRASCQHGKAAAGSAHWALLLEDNPLFPRLRLAESRHMAAGGAAAERSRSPPNGGPAAAAAAAAAAPPPPAAAGEPRRRPMVVDVVLLRCARAPQAGDPAEAPPPDAEAADTDKDDPDLEELCRQVRSALGGAAPSDVEIAASRRACSYPSESAPPEAVWGQVVAPAPRRCDVQVVAYRGPLAPQLRLASHLRSALPKLAPALAMDARRGIASASAGHSPSSAAHLFEVVVGVAEASSPPPPASSSDAPPAAPGAATGDLGSRLVLLLPLEGAASALESVRRQIRHGVRVAQGGH
jgi:molybdenum cofactor synthesis domain-containing protein